MAEISDIARAVRQSGASPITVTFTNPNPASLGRVKLFDAGRSISQLNSGLNKNMVATMSNGLAYEDFLRDIMVNPKKIKYVYAHAFSANPLLASAQLMQTITIASRDITGNIQASSIAPVLDPYASQGTVLFTTTPFILDKDTSMYLANFDASMTLTLSFYEENQFTGEKTKAFTTNEPFATQLQNQQKKAEAPVTAKGLPEWSKALIGIGLVAGVLYVINEKTK